jgi:flagellar secretion chaperone FliS
VEAPRRERLEKDVRGSTRHSAARKKEKDVSVSGNATSEYTRQAVLTASPVKLVVLMYDGAIRFMEQARLHLRRNANAACGSAITRAYNVVSELRLSLDFDAGGPRGKEIARELERLYTFVLDTLVQSNVERSDESLADAIVIMRTLKEGWDGIANAG